MYPAQTVIQVFINNQIYKVITRYLLLYDTSGIVGIGYNPIYKYDYYEGFIYYIKSANDLDCNIYNGTSVLLWFLGKYFNIMAVVHTQLHQIKKA